MDDFGKDTKHLVRFAVAIWLACIGLGLAFFGLIVWAIVKLVLHFT